MQSRPLGLVGAYVVGLAFAFGWTPCIGPILGAILLYASQQETVTQGVVLLSAYSAGLGIPFLLSALAVNWFFKASGGLRRSMRVVEVVSGRAPGRRGPAARDRPPDPDRAVVHEALPGPRHDRLTHGPRGAGRSDPVRQSRGMHMPPPSHDSRPDPC